MSVITPAVHHTAAAARTDQGHGNSQQHLDSTAGQVHESAVAADGTAASSSVDALPGVVGLAGCSTAATAPTAAGTHSAAPVSCFRRTAG